MASCRACVAACGGFVGIERRIKEAGISVEVWPGGLFKLLKAIFGGGDNEDHSQRRERPAVDNDGGRDNSENNKEE